MRGGGLDERAVSNNLAVVLMIVTVTIVAGVVFVRTAHNGAGPPTSVELKPLPPGSDPLHRELSVVNASANLTYAGMTVELDGLALKYDSSDSGSGYCVAPGGHVCVEQESWLPGEHIVALGDEIHIHGAKIAGAKIDILLDTRQAWEGRLAK